MSSISGKPNANGWARLQARATALDSPLKVDLSDLEKTTSESASNGQQPANVTANSASDLYAAAMKSGVMGQNADQNGQSTKEDFFNQDIKDLGYLPNKVVPQMSPFELKRGSVIPATLITGLNSDLPGRITAQISQNVYDSATGYRLVVPQGAKLFGRYDAKVSFGQERVLVVWTDLIFPNGSTLQIGGMAGTDAEGYGGFKDKVDRHLWRTFGSAALVALIGTGIDMSMPESSTLATQDTASDAARRNFAESFGRVAEQNDFQEPERPADDQHPPGLQIQRACGSGTLSFHPPIGENSRICSFLLSCAWLHHGVSIAVCS